MKYGFVKVAAAIPAVKVADCKFNAQQIDTQIAIADGNLGIDLLSVEFTVGHLYSRDGSRYFDKTIFHIVLD